MTARTMTLQPDLERLVTKLLPVAETAGHAIMEVHRTGRVTSDSKDDGSPVTEADRRSEAIILAGLREYASDIQIISEENGQSHGLTPERLFFLVDPLDGTREFLRDDDRGAFTVNIALIEEDRPIMGIVYAPALDQLYWGIVGQKAQLNGADIRVRQPDPANRTALASRSHRDPQTDQWLHDNGITETVSIGSSLKFCLVAQGEADVYPRFGPTMEWDTAAGHAVLAAAGGRVNQQDGTPLIYGKPGFRNSVFIAHGGGA